MLKRMLKGVKRAGRNQNAMVKSNSISRYNLQFHLKQIDRENEGGDLSDICLR